MRNTTRLLDVLDRAESGPIVDESQWDMLIVPTEVAQLQAQYKTSLTQVTDIVPSDDGLADRMFEAGLAMAERLGVYCISTSRRLLFTRREILDALAVAPDQVTMGEGNDRHTEHKRRVEDPAFLTIKAGGVGTPIPEELYLAVHQAYAQEPLVDAMINCTLERVYGRELRSRSPWEVLVGWHEAELTKAAVRRAGRPGLALGCVENAVSDIGELSATSYGGFSPKDWHHLAMISEFKTDYMALTKLAHLIRTDSVIHAFYNTIYGGSVGGKEGMAIAIVGGCILLQMIYMTNTHSVSPAHPFLDNDTTPEIMQAISLAQQALARNTHLLTDVVITPVSGPGTRTLLYECAAMAIMAAASGTCALIGPRSAAGIHPGHVSGLEARFTAEVARAAAGISRGEANRLVCVLVDKYAPELNAKPIGLRFDQVYDMITLKPLPEWQNIYEGVTDELKQLGLPIQQGYIPHRN